MAWRPWRNMWLVYEWIMLFCAQFVCHILFLVFICLVYIDGLMKWSNNTLWYTIKTVFCWLDQWEKQNLRSVEWQHQNWKKNYNDWRIMIFRSTCIWKSIDFFSLAPTNKTSQIYCPMMIVKRIFHVIGHSCPLDAFCILCVFSTFGCW